MASSTITTASALTQICAKSNQPKTHRSSVFTHALPSRRQALVLLTGSTVLSAVELKANAQDIPLFGLRKKLETVEKETEEIVKEGVETAERGIETAERGIETAEKEIETIVSFGGFAQAGVVVGAEALGVLVATSVVDGILGPEGQN
ncbi:hypothetical protein AQUCO_04600006v1 [Aquilegia coerulea]|uniref:Synechocystis YCF37 n=1 Tax=Aquilegia coerulea TaxID=218851 RepID=A0A2G5CLB2_AQUCA|nr:hypothetical protein AQUCO_04600006v1 [Aquilegia coerulea]